MTRTLTTTVPVALTLCGHETNLIAEVSFTHCPARADYLGNAATDDADRWARIVLVASTIPSDADLTDIGDVCRALMANRLCVADFDDILDDAIERAAENRLIRQ